MPPKQDAKNKGKGEPVPGKPPLLEVIFPVWNDAAAAAVDGPDKYEDTAGLVLPTDAQPYLDAWKRPEDLVQNMPNLPVVITKPGAVPVDDKAGAKGAKGAPPPASREFEGKLYAGHKAFEWLRAVMQGIMSAQQAIPTGQYLWELIYPKDPKDNSFIKPVSGKYRVKLFIMDTWRTVTIDDRIPVDLFGRPLLVGVMPLALWPLVLSKAVLKVMAALRIADMSLPNHVAAWQMLTGWPHEDLIDPLAGVKLAGGRLFDRLEDTVRGNDRRVLRNTVATVCLKDRALPPKPPPRIIVLTGPSAVGRRALADRLIAEYTERFGRTVSHTTRPPREHELHGIDYVFTTKAALAAMKDAGQFLETAAVQQATVAGACARAYMYGTSIATVREVAATGKVCVMSLDEQGAEVLQADKRIDACFVYVAPPSIEELRQRMAGRLKEAETTIHKRLAWADEQVKLASKPNLFDQVVPNAEFDGVYYSLKEAISTLSPIIRNRLRGLPAYVLDYSDLIPPNLVEKPFLKPVVLAGPTTGERKALLDQLAAEFPDVFAFPRLTTTRPVDEARQHVLSTRELAAARRHHAAALGSGTRRDITGHGAASVVRGASPSRNASFASVAGNGLALDSSDDEGLSDEFSELDPPDPLRPVPASVTDAEFDAAVASGALIEAHTELFMHPMMARRVGVSAEAVREVIKSGRLPLLELEAESVAALKAKGIDCLAVFLAPVSPAEYNRRLIASLTEREEEIAARIQAATAQITAAQSNPLFDHIIVNGTLEEAYAELRSLISRRRPDVIVPEAAEAAAQALLQAPPPRHSVLVVSGPNGGGRSAVATQLLTTLPNLCAEPAIITDRKPPKGAQATDTTVYVSAKELAKVIADGQAVAQWASEGGNNVITADALAAVVAAKKVAVLDVPEAAAAALLPALKAGPATCGALYVFVSSAEAARVAADSSEGAALGAAAAEATASGNFDLVVTRGTAPDAAMETHIRLSAHIPEVVPPPHRPLVIVAPFGTRGRQLLQQLFTQLPGSFASPLITTTKPSTNPEVDERNEMAVVSESEAAALVASGAFLFHQVALGHTYGVQSAHVQRVRASGKVCVIEVDSVENAKKMRAAGFDGVYVFLGPSSMDHLMACMKEEIASNPPLGYEPDEAAALFFRAAKAQVLASKAEGLFDAWIENDSDPGASFSRLAEAVHKHFPSVVVPHFVYGYGRALWDPAVREYGRHTLHVMVLGPAASGKTTQCLLLAAQFKLPHINLGDLLAEEIVKRTPIGMQAKQYTDATKTVPDEIFLQLLRQRLAQPDCRAAGWLLDGFPHTAAQAAELRAMGIEADKVIFLHAENSLLLDRTRYRKVDMDTGRVYHIAERDSLSPAITPLTPTGQLDTTILPRLHHRHDDSEENVLARLALWDKHVGELREVYEDVSLRVPAAGALPAQTAETLASFLSLEATVPELQVVPSRTLKELQYEVVDTLRWRRRQLLQVAQDDGKVFWVETRELAGNAHCLLLARNPALFPVVHQLRRLDLATVPRPALLWVKSPEPAQVLVTLGLGPQAPLEEQPVPPRSVLVLCGPEGACRQELAARLQTEVWSHVVLVAPVTTRPPRKHEAEAGALQFIDRKALQALVSKGLLAGGVVSEHDGHSCALRQAPLIEAWAAGLLPVVIAPLSLGLALKAAAVSMQLGTVATSGSRPVTPGSTASGVASQRSGGPPPVQQPAPHFRVVYMTSDTEALDSRLRAAGTMEEQELLHELALASDEAAAVQRAMIEPPPVAAIGTAASSLPEPANATLPPPDVLLPVPAHPDALAYQQLKELAANMWHKPRHAVACQLVLEQFDWKVDTPGATAQRLLAYSMAGGTLALGRGQHLLRISAATDYPHAIHVYAAPPCKPEAFFCRANELSAVMAEMCSTAHGQESTGAAVVTNLTGSCEPPAPGATVGVLRYVLGVVKPTLVTAALCMAHELLRRTTRMVLVDNATGIEVLCPSGRLAPTILQPQAAGYTLLATATAAEAARASVASPRGDASAPEQGLMPWVLQLLSATPLATCQESSITRAQTAAGQYTPNSRCLLGRHLLTPLQPLQLAVHAATQPPLPFRLRVCKAAVGSDVTWGATYPTVVERATTDASPTVLLSTSLEPGKYLVEMELDREACPEGWQPNPLNGAVAPVPGQPRGKDVAWRLTFLPALDEKSCPIVTDDSQQRALRTLQDAWSAAAAPEAPPTPPGKPAGKAPPPAKGGAAAAQPAVNARAVAAMAALEKLQAKDPAAASTVSPRPGKDGRILELRPDSHVRIIQPAPDTEPLVLPAEHLDSRVAESAPVAAPGTALSGVLSGDKDALQTVRARRLEEFGAWRSAAASGQQGALQARLDAQQAAQQQAAIAAL